MSIQIFAESFPLKVPFAISRGTKSHIDVIRVEMRHDGAMGQGECVPYGRYGESMDSVSAQIAHMIHGMDLTDPARARAALQSHPAGAARNAVDCALWDLQAKLSGRPVHDLAGLAAPEPVPTAFTLSLDTPDAMRAAAHAARRHPILKIKLGTSDDLARLTAVRDGSPEARLVIDANEGWSVEDYLALMPHLIALGVELVEQPFPAGHDAALADLPRPVAICADESLHVTADLAALRGRYDVVNIKLDKTGGLTQAIALRDAAAAMGFGIMTGCMLGTSLSMAPMLLLSAGARVVDLDGGLLLRKDRIHALRYDTQGVHPAVPALWG